MKIHCGYHKEGMCWKWKFDLTRYWKKRELWWFSFWRFYLVLDFVKDWLGDMIGKAAPEDREI